MLFNILILSELAADLNKTEHFEKAYILPIFFAGCLFVIFFQLHMAHTIEKWYEKNIILVLKTSLEVTITLSMIIQIKESSRNHKEGSKEFHLCLRTWLEELLSYWFYRTMFNPNFEIFHTLYVGRPKLSQV